MLIGLTGVAGSGKDTVCELIRDWGAREGVTVRREAFADRLKLSAARLFFPEIELDAAVGWANGLKLCGAVTSPHVTITGREFLQRYGTESHREVFGTDFWVDAALATYDEAAPGSVLVVTDVRFPNEAQAIHGRLGEIWRIVRPGAGVPGNHPSEAPLPGSAVNLILSNRGTIEDLRVDVDHLMSRRFGRPRVS